MLQCSAYVPSYQATFLHVKSWRLLSSFILYPLRPQNPLIFDQRKERHTCFFKKNQLSSDIHHFAYIPVVSSSHLVTYGDKGARNYGFYLGSCQPLHILKKNRHKYLIDYFSTVITIWCIIFWLLVLNKLKVEQISMSKLLFQKNTLSWVGASFSKVFYTPLNA